MLQLNQADVAVIRDVVTSVRRAAHRHVLDAKQRDKISQEEKDRMFQKVEGHKKRFDEIIAQAGKGYRQLVAALRDKRLQELFARINIFQLYRVADESTTVAVSVKGAALELSIKGSRVSCCQAAGKPTRYVDCETHRYYIIAADYVPEIFFRNISLEDFHCDWLEWLSAEDGSAAETLVTDRSVNAFDLWQFFSYTSFTIQEQTDVIVRDNEAAEEEGMQVLTAWHEGDINPGLILVRFFYDCADPAKLQKHLSHAIQTFQA